MHGKRWLVVLLVLFVGSFVSSSYVSASGSKPDLPSSLPAAALPKTSLSSAEQVAISNLIAPDAADRYGISADSYRNVRKLANTAAGHLYIIPGTKGLCLALADAVACNELSTDQTIVAALFVASPSGNREIGGGVLNAGGSAPAIVKSQGSRVQSRGVQGGFVVTDADGMTRSSELR